MWWARGTDCAPKARRARRLGFESLEGRCLPTTLSFGTVVGIGASGQYAALKVNAEAEDSAGDVIVVGSIMGSAPFNTDGGAAVTLSSTGNQDAYIAEFASTGALIWAETFPGQTTSAVGQASAVAVDSSGNIEVAGSFSGTIEVGSTVLTATSQTDVFVAKLNSAGQVQWAVQTTGTTNKVDTANAIAPDGSGGAYIAGSLMGSMTAGSTVLTAVGSTEAYAAHVSGTGQFSWAVSTTGSANSVAGIDGLAVDATGRLVMSGYYAGTVNFNPAGSTLLTAAGSYDVAVWVLNSNGTLAWAQGFGGSGYDQSDAVAVDPSGNIYVTGAFSGTVNFNPSGTAINLTAGSGGYNPFVLELSSTGSTVWADALVDSSNVAIANGIGVNAAGQVIVAGWFVGTVDFDPGPGTAPETSRGDEDVFVAALDGSGNFVAVATGGGSGTDTSFGLALGASGAIAIAGGYTGPSNGESILTTFGSTNLSTIGKSDIFVATLSLSSGSVSLSPPNAPALEAASDSGSSQSDGITNVTDPTFDISGDSGGLTVQLLRDGAVVATRVGNGPITDPGRVPDGLHQYTAREVDSYGHLGPLSNATQVTIDTTPPAAPSAAALFPADDSGTVGDGITNIEQPRLTGTAEAGATINLYAGSTLVGTGTASGGTYTIQLSSPLADGTYSITATATDVAGNVSVASAAFSMTIDTTPPAAPSVPGVLAADDSGTVGDGITNVTQPRLTGTAAAGSTVTLWIGGATVGTGTSTGGSYTIQLNSALADGTYSVTATAADVAGNVSAASAAFALTIDTTPPVAPAAPGLLAADDSGTVGDRITNVKQPRLTGTAAAGSTVTLLIAGVAVGTGTATAGAYTIQLSSPLTDGTYSITATATDAAGNTSAASTAFSLTIDTTPPAAPPAPALLPADDSGVLGDGITNANRPRLTGTATAGATVTIWIAGSVVGSGPATGGSYTIQLASALADGTYAITATATDVAGNVSAAGSAFSLTIDTKAPASPPVPGLLATDDSGVVGDGITNVNQPHIIGTAEAGATVTLWIAGAVVGTGTAPGGSYTIQLASALADGTYAVTAAATDVAGNASAASAPFTLTIDTTPPAAPPAPGLLAADDSGTVGDGITNVNRPRLTGSAEVGSSVNLSIAGSIVGTGTAIGGTYTIQLNAALADGTYSVTATATDVAGNTSLTSAAFTLTIDKTPPAAPSTPALLPADDSGAVGDGITNVNQPHLTGMATAGTTVNLSIAGRVVGTGVATGGAYTILLNSALADGTYSVTATATDVAGNASAASTAFWLTIDTTAPAAPAAPGLLADDDSGAIGDGITNVNQPHLTGTAVPGTTVSLYIGRSLAGTAVATGGSYTIQPASALADGTYAVTATATDVAGNTSAASAVFSLTIDTTAPAAPSVPGLLPADDSGAIGDGITNVTAPRLTGSAEPGSTVQLYAGTTLLGAGVATGGIYTIAVSPALAEGTYSVTATATDAAGNTSAASPAFSLTIDTTSPAAPSALGLLPADDSGAVGDGITNVNRPHLNVSSPAGTAVTLWIAGAVVGTGTATGGSYTIQLNSALADGTYPITATATDVAGNLSAPSAAFVLTIDTTPPANPPAPGLLPGDDSGVVGDGITNVVQPRLTGSAEPGATVTLFLAGAVVGTGAATGGTYTIQLTSPLTDGTYSITATATDAAGNTSAPSSPFSLTIDTVAPPMPTMAILSADASGVWAGDTTEDHHIRVSGVAAPGTYVQLVDAAGDVVGGATATSPGGAYTITTPTVPMGTYSYSTRAVDVAGNIGPADSPVTVHVLPTPGDYFGAGGADLITYDASTEVWSILSPSTGATATVSFGLPDAVPIPADYDGDGETDLAVYQPSTGTWLIRSSSTGTVGRYTFGGQGDIPVPDDYTGAGHAEVAVYRPSTAQWFVSNQATGAGNVWTFGYPNQSIPVPADYDGGGKVDLGVYVPATGGWYTENTTTLAVTHTVLGGPSFMPVPADYEGDGKADVAVYAAASSQWQIISSATGVKRTVTYGGAYVDVPVPADYDGDGKADLAVYWTIGSKFGLDLSGSGATQTWALGQPVLDEPAVIPTVYLGTDVVLAWNVTPPVIPPLPPPAPQPLVKIAAAVEPPPPAASVAPAGRASIAPSTPRGTPVAQAIKPKPANIA